jgi:hypothetical protein
MIQGWLVPRGGLSLLLVVVALLLTGCAGLGRSQVTLRVAAASDLQYALGAVGGGGDPARGRGGGAPPRPGRGGAPGGPPPPAS